MCEVFLPHTDFQFDELYPHVCNSFYSVETGPNHVFSRCLSNPYNEEVGCKLLVFM